MPLIPLRSAAPYSSSMATLPDSTATKPIDISPVFDWLVAGTPTALTPSTSMEQLANRLEAAGIGLDRIAIFAGTLHPEIMGGSFVWRRGEGVEAFEADFSMATNEGFRDSPPMEVMRGGPPMRRRLADPDCPMDYAVLSEFRDMGFTDYLIQPLLFTDGEIAAVSWVTSQPDGFSDSEVAALKAILAPLARRIEIFVTRRKALNLLNAYVGRNAGERILAGHIRRGDTERVHAAIWLADLRGFTAFAESMPGEEIIALLNDYYDCQVPPIEEHGGEVLKFMGDGLLAIFPVTNAADEAAVCHAALAAATKAQRRLADLNREREKGGLPVLRSGTALHVGELLYGNIGGAARVDFTAIGPAVNLAARLEALSAQLGRPVVLSERFASHVGDKAVPLGRHAVRGFDSEQAVFGLNDDDRD